MDQYLELRFAHKSFAPTYAYLFTHKGAASFTEIFKGGRENYWGKKHWQFVINSSEINWNFSSRFEGVSHAEELQYLFPIADILFISALPTKEDEEIRRGITELWVNFARTGQVTIERITFNFYLFQD